MTGYLESAFSGTRTQSNLCPKPAALSSLTCSVPIPVTSVSHSSSCISHAGAWRVHTLPAQEACCITLLTQDELVMSQTAKTCPWRGQGWSGGFLIGPTLMISPIQGKILPSLVCSNMFSCFSLVTLPFQWLSLLQQLAECPHMQIHI